MARAEGEGQEDRGGGARPVGLEASRAARGLGITLMSILGTSSVPPAFPEIAQTFSISQVQVSFLSTAFELPGVVVTFVAGMLSDRYGRRWMVVPSLFLFGVADAACAQASNFGSLVAAVAVPLGLGGA